VRAFVYGHPRQWHRRIGVVKQAEMQNRQADLEFPEKRPGLYTGARISNIINKTC